MATAMTRSVPKVVLIPLKSIVESSGNPRKTFRGIEELAADVGLRGILQPILLREKEGRYELVFGARRFRAAKLAGLPDVPAFIRELTDEQALELQIVENTQREDVHPLEEADGYRRLHEEFKYSVDEIAAKVGKSRTAIYERIKLCALVPAAREAFFDGKLSASTALLVARIPDKDLQAKAVKDLLGDGDPMSYREAVEHVQNHYMLQLEDAPFDITDAELVPKAGACSTCPKRTGNQRELFGDVKSPDVCTDPPCHKSKVDALWQLKVAEAKTKGQKVLTAKEAERHFPQYAHGRIESQTYADLDEKWWVKDRHVEVRKLVGHDAPPPVLARDRAGKIHELVPRAVADKARQRAEPPRPRGVADPTAKKQAAEAKRRWAIVRAASAAVLDKVRRKGPDALFWRVLIGGLTIGSWPAALREVCKARSWTEKSGRAEESVREGMLKLQDAELPVLALEIVIAKGGASYWGDVLGVALKQAAKAYGVDVEKIKAKVKAAGKKPAPAKKKPAAVCTIPGCGEPGKRTDSAPGLWCADHGKNLSIAEKKSIHARGKRLAGRT